MYQTPIDDLRLRVSQSRDTRAPDINELFAPGTQGSGTATDPFHGNQTVAFNTITVGNPNLKPETAETSTFGAVYAPSWVPGLSVTADYYNIDILNAIGTIGGQNIVNQCFAGVTNLCPLINYASTGVIAGALNEELNEARMINHGLDIEGSYAASLDSMVSGWPGDIVVRYLMTYVYKNASQAQGGTLIGTTGVAGNPHYLSLLTMGYNLGGFSTVLTVRYIPSVLSPSSQPA